MNQVVRKEVETAPIAQTDAAALVSVIERAARDPSVNLDRLERLIEMKERQEARASEQAFNEAMSKAQAEMRPVAADLHNSQTRSRYASYAALDRAMRPIYTRHGLSLSFDTEGAGEAVILVVCIVSLGGYSRRYSVPMPADGKGAKGGDVMSKTHAVGAAMTYGQRYLLKMIFNIAVGDDTDGNAPAGVISDQQVNALQALITETGSDIDKFLRWGGVESLADLPAGKFAAAKTMLEAKRGAK